MKITPLHTSVISFSEIIGRRLTVQQAAILAIAILAIAGLAAAFAVSRYWRSDAKKDSSYDKVGAQGNKILSNANANDENIENQPSDEVKLPDIRGERGGLLEWQRQNAENIFSDLSDAAYFNIEETQKNQQLLDQFIALNKLKLDNSHIEVTVYTGGNGFDPQLKDCHVNGCLFFTCVHNTPYNYYHQKTLGLSMNFVKDYTDADTDKKKELLAKVLAEIEKAVRSFDKKDDSSAQGIGQSSSSEKSQDDDKVVTEMREAVASFFKKDNSSAQVSDQGSSKEKTQGDDKVGDQDNKTSSNEIKSDGKVSAQENTANAFENALSGLEKALGLFDEYDVSSAQVSGQGSSREKTQGDGKASDQGDKLANEDVSNKKNDSAGQQ